MKKVHAVILTAAPYLGIVGFIVSVLVLFRTIDLPTVVFIPKTEKTVATAAANLAPTGVSGVGETGPTIKVKAEK
jgi:hypothetical protein